MVTKIQILYITDIHYVYISGLIYPFDLGVWGAVQGAPPTHVASENVSLGDGKV